MRVAKHTISPAVNIVLLVTNAEPEIWCAAAADADAVLHNNIPTCHIVLTTIVLARRSSRAREHELALYETEQLAKALTKSQREQHREHLRWRVYESTEQCS
ncbi:unnamed protein product [Heligmosomoides polygyrus]|uniref:Response regulatory domain-containing protein n=1 Tax=Heligmosomoides polygyrus TaxID=6339 RepID=A0A183G0V8_HELPZ|nr:unnamed protein product [Heligmosomoides polygyrus]